jgi:hypothetical protein
MKAGFQTSERVDPKEKLFQIARQRQPTSQKKAVYHVECGSSQSKER